MGPARSSPAGTEQGMKYERDQAYDGNEGTVGQRYVLKPAERSMINLGAKPAMFSMLQIQGGCHG